MGRLFGTDGVRGIANRELSAELACRLGRAAVTALAETGVSRPHIAVGRDTRASGEFLEAALTSGICSAGGDAVLLGVCTTPSVAFLTTDLGAEAGAVISASHNPSEYNGIKFFGASGYKLADEVEKEIEDIVTEDSGPRPAGRGGLRPRSGITRGTRHPPEARRLRPTDQRSARRMEHQRRGGRDRAGGGGPRRGRRRCGGRRGPRR